MENTILSLLTLLSLHAKEKLLLRQSALNFCQGANVPCRVHVCVTLNFSKSQALAVTSVITNQTGPESLDRKDPQAFADAERVGLPN